MEKSATASQAMEAGQSGVIVGAGGSSKQIFKSAETLQVIPGLQGSSTETV